MRARHRRNKDRGAGVLSQGTFGLGWINSGIGCRGAGLFLGMHRGQDLSARIKVL